MKKRYETALYPRVDPKRRRLPGMKFTLGTLFSILTVAVLAMVVAVSMRTDPLRIPDCIGTALTEQQVQRLLKRYQTETPVEISKSSTFTNENNTIRIEIFSNYVVSVELTLPIDPQLKIEIPPAPIDAVGNQNYQTSTTTVAGKESMRIKPTKEILGEIFRNVSYSVTDSK